MDLGCGIPRGLPNGLFADSFRSVLLASRFCKPRLTTALGHELVEMTMLETQSWLLESQNMDYSD